MVPMTTTPQPGPAQPSLPTIDQVESALVDIAILAAGEKGVHDAVESLLREAGLDPEREVRLTARDRVDLMVGRVAVEIKVAGDVIDVLRQCQRYARSDQVDSVLLVTTSPGHTNIPPAVGGKPLRAIYVGGGWLG